MPIFVRKIILTIFIKKSFLFRAKKNFESNFFVKVQENWKRNTLPDENGDVIGKFKKFGISWCIPHRMTSDY